MPSYPFNAADGLCAAAAQAAALCTLVIRGAQRGLTKAVSRAAGQSTPCPSALNVVGARVFERKACARARSSGLRGSSGPLRGKGGSGRVQEVPDPYGVRGLGCQLGSSLAWRHVASPDPSPGGERVRGRWPGEGRDWPVGPGYSVLSTQLRITTRVLPCCSKSGYPCYRVPT